MLARVRGAVRRAEQQTRADGRLAAEFHAVDQAGFRGAFATDGSFAQEQADASGTGLSRGFLPRLSAAFARGVARQTREGRGMSHGKRHSDNAQCSLWEHLDWLGEHAHGSRVDAVWHGRIADKTMDGSRPDLQACADALRASARRERATSDLSSRLANDAPSIRAEAVQV